jgi:hypothetical protein
MRELMRPFTGANKLNYLCILATELLGLDSLREIPTYLSGYNSVLNTLAPTVAQAIRTLRVCGFYPTTQRELRLMVDAYLNHHKSRNEGIELEESDKMTQLYRVEADFSICPLWSTVIPPSIDEALNFLIVEPPVRSRTLAQLQDVNLSASVRSQRSEYQGDIEPLGFSSTQPPEYGIERTPQAPGMVTWDELVAVANDFDQQDESSGRQEPGQRSWYTRLYDVNGQAKATLLQASLNGLTPATGLDLSGIKHLIGLPGAGKTTLLYLLAAWAAQHDLRACFLFPSIEVASGFLETLEQYDISCALLSGQSEGSRHKHAQNFAASLSKDSLGYGVTRTSAKYFATNCALAGFASEEEEPFPHANPPCTELQQRLMTGTKPQTRRCALSGSCALQHAERVLANANICAGHVLSLDRGVSRLFAPFDTKHFEFIARTFDLVVIDECDATQANLDARGTPIMKLYGEEESLWATLISDLHAPMARGRNAFVSGKDMPSLVEMTGRFGQATNRLSAFIQHMSKDVQKSYENQLLTSLSLISDMYRQEGAPDDDEAVAQVLARQGMERLWDAAIKPVAFRPSIKDDEESYIDLHQELSEIAQMLRLDELRTTELHKNLSEALAKWDLDADTSAVAQIARIMSNVETLPPASNPAQFSERCGLLLNVSSVVLQHFGLAPHLRLLNSLGLVGDNVFDSRPSRDQLGILPESISGRLSGIRYTVSDEGNINISHVGIQGVPRRLFDRMHQLGKSTGGETAYLLTSATSMLQASPRFHVNEGPHYVLQRPNAGTGWSQSRYEFAPVKDPLHTSNYLRFSGAKLSQRDHVLKAMVDGLLSGNNLSRLAQAIASNDVVNGVARKAGLVVNSYDQCQLLYEHITSAHAHWRGKVRFLRQGGANSVHEQSSNAASVTASDVESLGSDTGWDILIFPMSAIGRGVNIVYQFGHRQDKAMMGSLFFLTRPHPRQDDLGLIQGLIGRRSEVFDRQTFSDTREALQALQQERMQAYSQVKDMMRTPLIASRLGEYAKPFVADQMIIILQTIGRAMRGDCPAFVYFVDAAWAPRSASGLDDNATTSMLVMMQDILKECLSHPDPTTLQCYQSLYLSFAEPMSHISGLHRE